MANKLKVYPIRRLQLKTYATLFLTVILTNLISLFFLTKIVTFVLSQQPVCTSFFIHVLLLKFNLISLF